MFIRNLYPMQNYYCPDNLAIPYFKYLFAFFGPLTTQKRLDASFLPLKIRVRTTFREHNAESAVRAETEVSDAHGI